MAYWPPLNQKINYLLASQSIVWYLLRINGTDTNTDTGIGPSLLYNPITKISTIGYVIETLGNIIKTLKLPPTITVSVCYYTSC